MHPSPAAIPTVPAGFPGSRENPDGGPSGARVQGTHQAGPNTAQAPAKEQRGGRAPERGSTHSSGMAVCSEEGVGLRMQMPQMRCLSSATETHTRHLTQEKSNHRDQMEVTLPTGGTRISSLGEQSLRTGTEGNGHAMEHTFGFGSV